jgi:hypothetical protein
MEKRQRNSHIWDRGNLDWYIEPERVTHQLCAAEKFVGRIFDPCCGKGNIVKSLISEGYEATGSDLVDRAGSPEWFVGISDFLEDETGAHDNIVMNPPFFKGKGTEGFIRKALSVTRGKVCAFTEVRFLGSAGRANGLYAEFPPARIYYLTPRPSCPPGEFLEAGGKATGGTPDFCWLVFDNSVENKETKFSWLRGE